MSLCFAQWKIATHKDARDPCLHPREALWEDGEEAHPRGTCTGEVARGFVEYSRQQKRIDRILARGLEGFTCRWGAQGEWQELGIRRH